jgi:hypothetical protein
MGDALLMGRGKGVEDLIRSGDGFLGWHGHLSGSPSYFGSMF